MYPDQKPHNLAQICILNLYLFFNTTSVFSKRFMYSSFINERANIFMLKRLYSDISVEHVSK